jgi:predicted phage baseplate assembly protein
VVLSDVTVKSASGGVTALSFNAPLTRIYDAATVKVNANSVEATHGETVKEIMGSGDATNAGLKLQLKQSPLTYVSAATGNGVQSTLAVRVNNLLWSEADNFLNAAPADRAYITLPNSRSGPVVQFGDGVHGSRTPTGQSNIVATYRKGIGAWGNVSPGQLTQPLDRPQGLQAVTNPSAGTGGADPATPVSARASAPLPTLTLGRVVSLEDYQNFALNFGGIALALASWTWFGATRGVFLTVAGEGGTVLNANDQVVVNLLSALQNFGLPYVPVQVVSYTPVLFEIAMQVKVDTPTYDPGVVLGQVWQSLAAAFAFGKMQPGQSVAASYVIQLAQQVGGVMGVNMISLNRSGEPAVVQSILCAAGPLPTRTPPAGGEILLLDPAAQGNVGVWA